LKEHVVMRSFQRKFAALAVSAALLTAPAAAVASTPISATTVRPTNDWLMLSMLSPASAVVLQGSAAAAAQPAPPPPPPQSDYGPPPLAWLGVVGLIIAFDVYLILSKSHHHNNGHPPISPA
jgi:hypothetical protein